MKTVTVQIGNSDDRLTQEDWVNYIKHTGEHIEMMAEEIHFSGGSSAEMPWQNYCWVFQIEAGYLSDTLQDSLARLKNTFGQDSIAWTEGQTEFI